MKLSTAASSLAAQIANLPKLAMSDLWVLWDKYFPRRPPHNNRAYVEGKVRIDAPDGPVALCFDPQTSGGLLAAVAPERESELRDQGWWRAGVVDAGPAAITLS